MKTHAPIPSVNANTLNLSVANQPLNPVAMATVNKANTTPAKAHHAARKSHAVKKPPAARKTAPSTAHQTTAKARLP